MLIGRDVELDLVTSALAARRSVVAVGCLGAGRSSFARAVADAHGVPVLTPTASMSDVPFAVVADRAVGRDTTERLAAVAQWLSSMPLVVVDDAHLLDPQTSMSVHLAARSVPVLATVLEHAPVDDAITDLWRRGGTRVELAPLDAADADRLLAHQVGHELDPWAKLHAAGLCGGLPGVIVAVADGVRALATSDVHQVAELAPLASLGERCRSALATPVVEALALLGVVRDCAEHEFERCCGHGTLTACGALVTVDGSGRVRPRSTHLALAASGAVAPDRLVRLLGDIDVAHVGHLGRIAVLDARREPVAPSDLLAGALEAAHAHRTSLAVRLLERAAEADPGDLLLATARVGALLDRPEHVEVAAARSDAVPLRPDQRVALAALAATVAAGRPDSTPKTVMAAIDRLDTDPAAASLLEAQRIALLYELGRFDEAIARRRALGDTPGRAVRMQVFIAEAGYRMAIGDTTWVREQAVTHLANGMALGPEAVRPVIAALLVALIFEFQFDEAERILDMGDAVLGRSNPEQRVMMLAARAALETNRSRTRSAERIVLEAVALARAAQWFDLLPILGALGVHACTTGGHTERLSEHLERARLPSRTMPGVSTLLSPGAEGAAAMARGDQKRAVSHALVAAQQARTLGLPGAEVLHLAGAVRFGATSSLRAAHVVRVRNGFTSPVLRVLADRIVATERADPFGLMEAGEFYAARDNALEATECALQAAAAARQGGRDDLATECDLRALEWEARLDGLVSPLMALLRGGGGRFQLTRRERDVVELAMQGLSNREIAERTFTSVRTVEGHLMRAYAKLGVSGREGLRRGGVA